MARKREEKARQSTSNNQQKENSSGNSPAKEKNFHSLKQQLVSMKLALREIPGDGNCLFGALADQLDGTPKTHQKHRQDVVSYMRSHREDFEPFVEDDIPFDRHLSNLAELGTYGGNECIVAFARLNKVKVIIHQLNAPLWQIDGSDGKENVRELHISYHNGDHYNSVRKTGDYAATPTNIKLTAIKDSSNGDGRKDVAKQSSKSESYSYYMYEENDLANNEDLNGMMACSDVSSDINYIIEQTGCEDIGLIKSFHTPTNYDVAATITELPNYLLHIHKGEKINALSPIWGPDGTGTRIFGSKPDSEVDRNEERSLKNLPDKLKPNVHISNARRKELKKQLRKQQGMERKKSLKTYEPDFYETNSSDDSSGESLLVKDLGCLSI